MLRNGNVSRSVPNYIVCIRTRRSFALRVLIARLSTGIRKPLFHRELETGRERERICLPLLMFPIVNQE